MANLCSEYQLLTVQLFKIKARNKDAVARVKRCHAMVAGETHEEAPPVTLSSVGMIWLSKASQPETET